MLDGVCCLKLNRLSFQSQQTLPEHLTARKIMSQFFNHILIIMFSSCVDTWVGLQTYSLSSTPRSTLGQTVFHWHCSMPVKIFAAISDVKWGLQFPMCIKTTDTLTEISPRLDIWTWFQLELLSWNAKTTRQLFASVVDPGPCQCDLDILAAFPTTVEENHRT